jgi:hypothetical protein
LNNWLRFGHHCIIKLETIILTLETNSYTPRRYGSGENNEYITNTRGKLEHSTKKWKCTNQTKLFNHKMFSIRLIFVLSIQN